MFVESLSVILLLCVLAVLLYVLYKLQKTGDRIEDVHNQIEQTVQTKVDRLFVQLESYLSLRDKLDLHQGLPYTAYWSASPDFLKIISEYCLDHRTANIVECSSGLSSLVLARCCEMNKHGQVLSLENGEEFALKTERELERYAVNQYAAVVHAPLQVHTIKGVEYQWYSLHALPEDPIDMLVIDGPPGYIQRHSRYPALPLLFDRLADQCTVFMDDAARDDEKEIVKMWQSEFPGIEHQYVETERGCSILRINKAG